MGVRRLRLALALGFAAVVAPASAWADTREFTQQDYDSYFSPGRFVSHSPYYGSDGALEVISRRTWSFAGRHYREEKVRTIDASQNYDDRSVYPFYKIISEGAEQMVWDERRSLFVMETSREEFENNLSHVWESHDSKSEVSPGDRDAGPLHPFYQAADRKAGRAVKALREQHRKDVTGAWTWRCAWLDMTEWDVECAAVHLPTQREELYYYRKVDLFG